MVSPVRENILLDILIEGFTHLVHVPLIVLIHLLLHRQRSPASQIIERTHSSSGCCSWTLTHEKTLLLHLHGHMLMDLSAAGCCNSTTHIYIYFIQVIRSF